MTENSPLSFIDSNLWIYAFIKQQAVEKAVIARTLISQSKIVVSTQVINEVCFNLLRKTNVSESYLHSLILSFYKKYQVVTLDQGILLESSQLRGHYRLSFWDSIIVASALSVPVECLYSEDLQHGLRVNNQLSIINPFIGYD
jgi:predicted nucleic acid-binding protein